MKAKRFLLIADVGGRGDGDRWHVGDEAILAATVTWLRCAMPETELTVASSSPEWTRRLYNVDSVPCLDFGDDTNARDAHRRYRSIVHGFAHSIHEDKEPWRMNALLASALRETDAVLFCGAGNLCSAFPNRLYERITIAALCRILGKAYAFGAQTIGPLQGETDWDEVARALAGAEMVGTRDHVSAGLASDMGVTATPMADESLYLTTQLRVDATARIGVTLHRSPMARHPYDAGTLAKGVDSLAEAISATVRFIPHFRGPNDRWSDVESGRELARHLCVPMVTTPWCDPIEAIQATAACRIIVSTRYHPLAFALGAGIPAIGLYQDGYHLTKMGGLIGMSNRKLWLDPMPLI